MKESIYKNYDELPLFLNAATVAKVLGIAPSSSYELMHEKDFPALRIGNRIVVPKEAFIRWVEHHNVWTIIYSLRREDAARLGYPSKKSSVPSRTPSFRKRSVCGFNSKNLLHRLLQIRRLQVKILRL